MRIIIYLIAYVTILQAFGFVFALEYLIAKKKIRRFYKLILNIGEIMFAIVFGVFPSVLLSIDCNVNWKDIHMIMVILDILISKIAVKVLIKFGIKIPDLEN